MPSAVVELLNMAEANKKVNYHSSRMGWVDHPRTGEFSLSQGVEVLIKGLSRRAELNDQPCKVVDDGTKFDGRGRVRVKLLDSGQDVWIDPKHLERRLTQVPIRATGKRSFYGSQEWGTGKLASSISDVSTAAPSLLGGTKVTSSAPTLPTVEIPTPWSLPSLPKCASNHSALGVNPYFNVEVHKVSTQGRGFKRRPDGGFFSSVGCL
eukprot:TRINITY_DN36124_c0_g1_i1.p1 TRINITY_DN36124_c0_g1~~TRINITY_DN36124_c0_g1_i1.p1  ORF type:complete len:208 (+),score=17.38 TRINITY_DN36124_c0_g1_i1:105-728(+)